MEASFLTEDGSRVAARLGQVLMVDGDQAQCCYPDSTGRDNLVSPITEGMGRRVFGSRDGIRLGTAVPDLPLDGAHIMVIVDGSDRPTGWVAFPNYEAARVIHAAHAHERV